MSCTVAGNIVILDRDGAVGRKLRRYSGLDEPALEDWIDEARVCIIIQRLEGEAAANFLVS